MKIVINGVKFTVLENSRIAIEDDDGVEAVEMDAADLLDVVLAAGRKIEKLHNKGADAQEGYWWCQHCVREVHPAQVTYEENHANCGARVEWRTDK